MGSLTQFTEYRKIWKENIMKDKGWDCLPNWAQDEIAELEQDLFDGFISFTKFNKAVEDIESEAYSEYYEDDIHC